MGKKRRALAAPQKFKARYRTLRGNTSTSTPAATTENSVVAAQLAEEQTVQVTETPVQEIATETVETTTPTETEVPTLEATPTTTATPTVTKPTAKKTSSTRTSTTPRRRSTRTRRTKASKTDSTKAE